MFHLVGDQLGSSLPFLCVHLQTTMVSKNNFSHSVFFCCFFGGLGVGGGLTCRVRASFDLRDLVAAHPSLACGRSLGPGAVSFICLIISDNPTRRGAAQKKLVCQSDITAAKVTIGVTSTHMYSASILLLICKPIGWRARDDIENFVPLRLLSSSWSFLASPRQTS